MINWYPGVTLRELEKEAIQKALQFYRWNKTATAQSLGISVRTIDNKIAKYEIKNPDEKPKTEDLTNGIHA
jgi:DNA-binding NtrC family response regulator